MELGSDMAVVVEFQRTWNDTVDTLSDLMKKEDNMKEQMDHWAQRYKF